MHRQGLELGLRLKGGGGVSWKWGVIQASPVGARISTGFAEGQKPAVMRTLPPAGFEDQDKVFGVGFTSPRSRPRSSGAGGPAPSWSGSPSGSHGAPSAECRDANGAARVPVPADVHAGSADPARLRPHGLDGATLFHRHDRGRPAGARRGDQRAMTGVSITTRHSWHP